MDVQVNEILTNGMIAKLKEDPGFLGFIVGALDSGWTVSVPGAVIAKLNKVKVMTHANGETVYVFLGTQLVKEFPRRDFHWCEISVNRGTLFYHDRLVCKTAPDRKKQLS